METGCYDAVKVAYNDMCEDTKMIREKRKMKKAQASARFYYLGREKRLL
jgi:hypothetical protein